VESSSLDRGCVSEYPSEKPPTLERGRLKHGFLQRYTEENIFSVVQPSTQWIKRWPHGFDSTRLHIRLDNIFSHLVVLMVYRLKKRESCGSLGFQEKCEIYLKIYLARHCRLIEPPLEFRTPRLSPLAV
jgi:hypothetical protein